METEISDHCSRPDCLPYRKLCCPVLADLVAGQRNRLSHDDGVIRPGGISAPNLPGSFAGVWIDRLKRKHVAIAADMFIGLVAVVFAVLLWVGHPLLVCLRGSGDSGPGNVFHTPCHPVHRAAAGTAGQAGPGQWLEPVHASGAFMLGPVIGAAMYAALPLPVILLTDFIAHVLPALQWRW